MRDDDHAVLRRVAQDNCAGTFEFGSFDQALTLINAGEVAQASLETSTSLTIDITR